MLGETVQRAKVRTSRWRLLCSALRNKVIRHFLAGKLHVDHFAAKFCDLKKPKQFKQKVFL